jgi:penicillin-binding protein 2
MAKMSAEFRVKPGGRMKIKIITLILVLMVILTSCGKGPSQGGALPTPVVNTTSVPDVSATAESYLDLWKSSDYAGMYAMLAQTSRDAITETDFQTKYKKAASSLTLTELDYSILSLLVNPASAKVGYQVDFSTGLFGDVSSQTEMNLILENGTWKVQWDDGMILKELAGGNTLLLNIEYPSRGSILDRNGDYLVTQTDAVAMGIDPNNVSSSRISLLLQLLAEMTKKPVNVIAQVYSDGAENGENYIPIGEVSKEVYDNYAGTMESIPGFVKNEYTSRYYYTGGVASQVLGYTQIISAENLEKYQQLGYAGDEYVGQAGLEKWGESYLAGKPQANLYVMAPDGTTITRLFEKDPLAANNINITIDKDLQLLVQKALLGFNGAAIVMEVKTGKILAMASSPGYDPNLFQVENYNNQYQLGDVINDTDSPMWNRATQSSYPLGSVFKVISMSAALESGLYKADTIYDCTSQWTELGTAYDDWTYTKELPPSGELTLVQGLMRSCNPYFYHIGLDLYRTKGATYLADMARGFGLGEATGIVGLQEDAGAINNPTDDGAASQMGIGQGDMLVTPIQVVDFIAAIANGGTLYTPQIIESVTDINGNVVESFEPQVRGTLPVSQATLDAVRQGMHDVINESKGTAYSKFVGLNIAVSGKTGTATTSLEDPHSWFAGFTTENRTDKADIAVVVILENKGDGSAYAAPVFRRIVEDYFYGEPIAYYPWEQTFYLTYTPTYESETTPAP